MTLFDPQWFTGFQTAVTGVATAMAGALAAWGVLRRKYSADSLGITEDKGRAEWMKDMREFGRLEAKLAAADAALRVAQERLNEYAEGRERLFGGCEERVRSLSEKVLDLDLSNKRLFVALGKHDPEEAERLMLLQLRPGPPGKGDEPP